MTLRNEDTGVTRTIATEPDGRYSFPALSPGNYVSNYGECFNGNVKVDTPDEFKAYDPKLYELISRVFDTHRIPMDVFHGKQVRKVACPPNAAF